ncbi:MAG TPA: FAD-binding oxidoreductase [Vicinamibacterales bacterium]|nr:FAD-binding oxidoreductase [Vicinamibacterales bacterium]
MKTTADVVIVGGGCMGASVAYYLAERGITDVVLLEREPQLGTGSTGRNAGGFRHQFSHPANIELSRESIAVFANFEEVIGHPIDFWPDGYLFLLSSDASVSAFRKNVDLQRAHGISVDWLSASDAAALCRGLAVDGVIGATYCGDDGIADPNGVTQGFARTAQSHGIEIRRGEEVTGIRVEGGRIAGVETTSGVIATPNVVNAAGAWARGIGRLAGADVPVTPERRHIFIAQPPGGGSWHDEAHRAKVPASRLMVIDFESTFYFHREGGGLLFGMGDPEEQPGFDITVRWDFLPEVIAVAVKRLPALSEASVSHAWAGLYEMTPDHNPIIGPAPEVVGFYTIAGFSGHGFQHSPAAGRILADLIVGQDPGVDISTFAPDRFAAAQVMGELNIV